MPFSFSRKPWLACAVIVAVVAAACPAASGADAQSVRVEAQRDGAASTS